MSRRRTVGREDFERAVREHHAAVFSAALRIARDESAALDAVQQVYVRLLQGAFDARGGDLGRLLRCAAAREALMRLRSERARTRRELEVGMHPKNDRAEERVSESETWSALRRCVAELPDELRHAVVLRYAEGLTLAEVGRALSISEPSALARVRRALERLRERMTRLGFAAFAPSVDEGLAPEIWGAEPPPAVPGQLEAKLLALSAAPAPASVGAVAALLAAVAVAVAGFAATFDTGSRADSGIAAAVAPAGPDAGLGGAAQEGAAVESARIGRSGVPAEDAGEREPPAQDAVAANGIVEARIVDELGFPVAGAKVRAASVERDGKFSVHASETTSGSDGRFRLELPVEIADGQDYSIIASTGSTVGPSVPARVRARATTRLDDLVLAGAQEARRGSWEALVLVLGPDGRPVEGVQVVLARSVRNAQGQSWLDDEARGSTDARGEARLAGEWLGAKVLTATPRGRELAPARERIEVEVEGSLRRTVTLAGGRAIRGTIVDETGAPLDPRRLGNYVSLHATAADPNQWFAAEFPDVGRFVVDGLADVPHTLRFHHDGWSTFTLRGIEPGGPELALALKAEADPVDRGNHDAEIHGTVVDAATGEPLALDVLDAWLHRLEPDCPALRDGDFGPLYLEGVFAQVADMGSSGEAPPRPERHEFVHDGLEPGAYLVALRARDHAPAFLGPIELGEREISSGHVVRLGRGATVSGVVRSASGAPLADAFVIALEGGELSRRHAVELDGRIRASAGRGFQMTIAARTDALGRFEIANVPAHRGLHLVALHPEHEPHHGPPLELREGRTGRVELRFATSRAR